MTEKVAEIGACVERWFFARSTQFATVTRPCRVCKRDSPPEALRRQGAKATDYGARNTPSWSSSKPPGPVTFGSHTRRASTTASFDAFGAQLSCPIPLKMFVISAFFLSSWFCAHSHGSTDAFPEIGRRASDPGHRTPGPPPLYVFSDPVCFDS